MNIESAIRHLEESPGVLPRISVEGGLIWLLESDVLCAIESTLHKRGFHGAVFVSSEDDVLIPSLATFWFSPEDREKDLGWHIDAFHKPESVVQRLTALYSPLLSHSTAATFTTETSLVDERAEDLFPGFWVPDDIARDYAWRIERLLWWKKRGFHTLLQNVSLADRQLNATSKNAFFHIRDKFTRGILDDPGVIKGEFTAQADVASLLIFRNGLWPNRDVAHTRFHTLPTPRFSHGIMYNLSIEEGGIIHTKTPPDMNIPSGVKYVVGEV